MSSDHMIQVNEDNFEEQVLAHSHNVPVILEFWAEWSMPSQILTTALEKLAEKSRGSFRLARTDVDANRNLSLRYGVHTVPSVKAFMKGQVVAEFTGLQTEEKLGQFIKNLAPNPADLLVEKGESYFDSAKLEAAEIAAREALQMDPQHPGAQLVLIRVLLMTGRVPEASHLILHFPASHQYSQVEMLKPLLDAYRNLDEAIDQEDEPLGAAYWNNIRLGKRGNVAGAIDGMLDLLRANKHYLSGKPREMILAWLILLGEGHPATRTYRAELASILF